MNKLLEHPVKLASFSDPWTYNAIGLAELNLGLTDGKFWERARESFKKGLEKAGTDDSELLFTLHANLWRYYLAVNDADHAKKEVELAKKFEVPPDFGPWEKAEKWPWFQEFFKGGHKIDKAEIKKMYQEMVPARD